jgi:uncharacterized protein
MLTFYIIAFFAGLIAGIINTLAGNGSVLTLYVLMDMFNLPAHIANATNRLGFVSQGIGSIPQFYKSGQLNLQKNIVLLTCIFLGAMLGFMATFYISEAQFKFVIKYLLLLLLFVLLIKPEKWLRQTDLKYKLPTYLLAPAALLLGFYGGFIQMGMGIFLIVLLVLGARYSLAESNAVKIVSTVSYSAVGLIIFAYHGLIEWQIGLTLASGQLVGGFIGGYFSANYPNAPIWVYRLLIGMVLISVARLFGFFELLYQLTAFFWG